eukprot:13487529-Alexandrium_andersonii.AAC.1
MCIRDRITAPRFMNSGKSKIVSGVRNLNCAGTGTASHIHPRRPRPGGSASFCALGPMVVTKQAGGRAGGASRG